MKVKKLLEKYGRGSLSEGSSTYDSIERMPKPNQEAILTLELVNGIKLRAGIIKETSFSRDKYRYAYITLDKKKYIYNLIKFYKNI